MRFLVIVKATKDSEAGILPSKELMNAMGAFNEGLVRDGILLSGDGLKPTSKGARMIFGHGEGTPRVVDGPFTETKELVAGFWILQGRSKEEIIERMKSAPFDRDEEIEIRPFYEPEDFAGIL